MQTPTHSDVAKMFTSKTLAEASPTRPQKFLAVGRSALGRPLYRLCRISGAYLSLDQYGTVECPCVPEAADRRCTCIDQRPRQAHLTTGTTSENNKQTNTHSMVIPSSKLLVEFALKIKHTCKTATVSATSNHAHD